MRVVFGCDGSSGTVVVAAARTCILLAGVATQQEDVPPDS
jgi:hypothetical protein